MVKENLNAKRLLEERHNTNKANEETLAIVDL